MPGWYKTTTKRKRDRTARKPTAKELLFREKKSLELTEDAEPPREPDDWFE